MNGISLVEHDFLNFLHFWNSLGVVEEIGVGVGESTWYREPYTYLGNRNESLELCTNLWPRVSRMGEGVS